MQIFGVLWTYNNDGMIVKNIWNMLTGLGKRVSYRLYAISLRTVTSAIY